MLAQVEAEVAARKEEIETSKVSMSICPLLLVFPSEFIFNL